MSTYDSFDEITQFLAEDVVNSNEQNDTWSIFADWNDVQQPKQEMDLPRDTRTQEFDSGGSYSCIPDYLGCNPYSLKSEHSSLPQTIPSGSVSPIQPSYDFIYSPEPTAPRNQDDFQYKMEAKIFPPTDTHQNPSLSHFHTQSPHRQFTDYQQYKKPQTPHQIPSAFTSGYPPSNKHIFQYPEPPIYSQAPQMHIKPLPSQQPQQNKLDDFKFVPTKPFYEMTFSGSDSNQPKVKIEEIPNYYGSSNQYDLHTHSYKTKPVTFLQERDGNHYTDNFDSYYSQDVKPSLLFAPPLQPIAKKQSVLNSKGKRKTDHELREEFYRREFRLQTGGKDPPPFTPTRSALDESFKWRPAVNKEYGINIPVYRRLNGKLDSPTTCSRSGRRVRTKEDPKSESEDSSRSHVPIIGESSWKGDIAYYFKKSRYAYIDEETGEELDTGVEEFERGAIVAILSDGTVTRNTSDPDTKFLSVVPGSVSDQLSPWKTLPDPVPEPIEDYQLVSLLGMVYVRVKDSSMLQDATVTKIRKNYVILPSGNNDGFGLLCKKKDGCPMCTTEVSTCCKHVVAVPFDNTVLPLDVNGDLVLCLRSGDTVRPLLESLRKTNNSLASLKEEQQNEMDNLTAQVKQLGLDFQEHLKVHDSHDADVTADATEHKHGLLDVPVTSNANRKLKTIPLGVEHVQIFPCESYQSKHTDCPALSAILKIRGAISILESDAGKMIALEPYNSSYHVQNPPSQVNTIDGAILFDIIADNSECRTYCLQKRDSFLASDIRLLLENKYICSVNGLFSEIYVQDRFIIRIMRVVRNYEARKFFPIISIPQLYPNIQKALSSNNIMGGILSDSAENGTTILQKPSPSEETSFKQMLKNGQWDDVCLYVTSHQYSPVLLQSLSQEMLSQIKQGLDGLLQMKYKTETKNCGSVSLLIKDLFFPPLKDCDSLVIQIKQLACYYVTLLPASEKSLTLSRMNAITVAIKNNPVMCLKWASKNNLRILSKYVGWNFSTKEAKYPNTVQSCAALRIYNCLLHFSCIIRKLGNDLTIIVSTALSILVNRNSDSEVNSLAFSILLRCAKDPFTRKYLGSLPQMQSLLQDSIEYDEKYKPIVEQIKSLMRQMFFTQMFTADDIKASVPFCAKLPYPTPSGRDRMWDTFLILHFKTPRPQKEIKFWVKLSPPGPFSVLQAGAKNKTLTVDFLDTSSTNSIPSTWECKLVHDRKVYSALTKSPRSKDDNLWHIQFQLSLPDTGSNKNLPWIKTVPKKGLYLFFHGTDLPSNSWIALGAVTVSSN